jgi:hypothetical protein
VDFTDEFDTRLQAMQRANAPKAETEAAIVAYERLRTARAIARSLLEAPSNSDVLAVFAEIGTIAADAAEPSED